MEWYREQTIQLIDLFRARPALWDTSSVHYRNKRLKNEALEQISNKLKCPKEEIAKKICTLRVQFSRENVKVKRAREAGAASYNPKWFGYQLLCFLNDQSRYTTMSMSPSNVYSSAATVESGSNAVAAAAATAQETISSAAQNQTDPENQHFPWSRTSEDSYADANDASVVGYEADSVLASMMHESMDDYHNQEPIVDVQEPQTWSSCRKYRNNPVTNGYYSDDDGGGTYSNSRKMMRMSKQDEFNTFSDYVAERMRNLKADKALQLMARRDIEQVLFKYEMKLLEQKKDSQQQQQPDTEEATTSKSISPSPVSDMEQQ